MTHSTIVGKHRLYRISALVFLLLGLLILGGRAPSRANSSKAHSAHYFLPFVQEGYTPILRTSDVLIIGMPQGISAAWIQKTVKQKYGGQLQDSIPQLSIYRFDFPQGLPSAAMQQSMKLFLGARYIEPDISAFLSDTVPNDPRYSDQWAHRKIDSPRAWDVTQGSSDVIVAIVDTGVDLKHPDLKDRLTPPSTWYDYAEDDSDPSDTYGHGTHVAGIAAATGNNGLGVSGAGWRTSIMPIKVFPDGKGSTSTYYVAKGVVHAVDHGADIINLSLGSTDNASNLADAVKYAYDHGVLVVAAAGNNNSDALTYPAANEHVVAVAATGSDDKKASFSNYGDWVDIAAPGVSILSTMPTYHVKMNDDGVHEDYDYLSGTSMASPLVAGVAALLKAVHPTWNPDQLAQQLGNSADNIDAQNPDYVGKLGRGRTNAGNALQGDITPTPTATAKPTGTPTATAQPTGTPTTAAQPTDTPTGQPTSTPTPTVTATPPNLLPNPSFELGDSILPNSPLGWQSSGSGTGWTHTVASDGSSSLTIGPCMMSNCGFWLSDEVSVNPTDSYHFSADLMATFGMEPGLAFQQWNSTGDYLGEVDMPITQSISSSWQTWETDIGSKTDTPFNPDTVLIQMRLFIKHGLSGSVWFDNLYLGDITKR